MTIKVTPEFIVCCRKSKVLDSSDIAVELSQYKSNCNKCENILRDVRGMIGELKKVKGNEVLGACHYCKTLCKTASCERCRFLRKKFLKDKPSSAEQHREHYKEWLSEVKGLLKIVLQDKAEFSRRNEHEKKSGELADITKQRGGVPAEYLKRYAIREHGRKAVVDKTLGREKLDEYVTQSDSVRYKKDGEFKPQSNIVRQRDYDKRSYIDEYGNRQEFDTQNDSGKYDRQKEYNIPRSDIDKYGKRDEYGTKGDIDYNKRKEYGARSDFDRNEKPGGYDTRGYIDKYDKQRNYDTREYIDRYDKRVEYERRNNILKGVHTEEKKQEYDTRSDVDTYTRQYGKRDEHDNTKYDSEKYSGLSEYGTKYGKHGEYTEPKTDTVLQSKRSLYDKRGGFETNRRYEKKPQQGEYDELRDTQSLENLKRLLRVLKTPFDETVSGNELDSLIQEITSPKHGHKPVKETALSDSVEDLIKLVKSVKKTPFDSHKTYGKTESEHERDEINKLLHIINKMVETKQTGQRKAAAHPTGQVHESPPEVKKLLQHFERSPSKREYDIDFFPPKPIAITSEDNIVTRVKESKKLKPKISVIIKDQVSEESIGGFTGLKSALKKPDKKPSIKVKLGIEVPSGFTLHTLSTPSKKKTKPKKQTTFAGNEIIKPRLMTKKEEISIKIVENQGDETSETNKTKSVATSMVTSSNTPSQVEMSKRPKAKKPKVLEEEEEYSPPPRDLIALLKEKRLKKHGTTKEKKVIVAEKDKKSDSETEKTLQSGLENDEKTPSKESKLSKTGILKSSKSTEDTNLKTEPKSTKKALLTQSMLDYRESPKLETHEIKKHVVDMPHEAKSTIDIRSLMALEDEKKSSASLLRLKPLFTVESCKDETKVEPKKKRSKNKGSHLEFDDDESSSFEEEKENRPDTNRQSKAYAKMFSRLLKERDTEKKALEKLKRQKSKIQKIPHIASLPALRMKAMKTYENIVGGVVVCDEQGEPAVPVHMIKGTEIVRFDSHYKEKMLIHVKEPLLFRSHPECPPVTVAPKERIVEESINKIGKSKSTFDRLLSHDTKGVFRYELSNREFIDKGLTKLPTIKIVRRGNHGANLLRHFYTQHRQEYHKIILKNKENKENIPPTKNATTISRVIENCTNLVTIHGRPFSIFEDEAFKNLIAMIDNLDNKDHKSINVKNIKQEVQDKAYGVRRQICDEIKEELISLKIDVASVKSRRFLGVNIQYIKNGKIVLRNLGVIELHERNTAAYLKDTVHFVLSRYGVELKNLYSITSDNGANMLCMSRQLEQELQESFDTPTIPELAESEEDHDVEVEYLQLIQVAEDLDFDETGSMELPKITAVRCAAHTLQLSIRDACREVEVLLETCRRVARSLRSPNNALRLKENNLPQAIIDCPTRWDSTADMLERMLLFKEFLIQNPDLLVEFQNNMNDAWSQLEECYKALTPCRVLSKNLQNEQLTYGDFYLSWVRCILQIEQLNTAFGFFLVRCMKDRENALMDNDCFIAAIYLDPRTNFMLTVEKLERGRSHLLQTYQRLERLTPAQEESEVGEEESPSTSAIALDAFLQAQFRQRRRSSLGINCENLLKRNLIEFLDQPLLESTANILHYWETKKSSNPQLYKLSNIILATPPTQVSVERLFSSLKFVMNNLRMSLNDDIIDDILLVRNNALFNK